jgi:hypothetical protein
VVAGGAAKGHHDLVARALVARELSEFLDHALVDRAFERNDQIGEIFHRLPPPADELGLVPTAAGGCDIDLAILTREAYGVPFLPLAAVAALPGPAGNGARNIIDQPIGDFAELLDGADAGFLIE